MILNFKVLVTIFYFLYIHFWVGFSFGLSQIDGVPGHIGRKGVHQGGQLAQNEDLKYNNQQKHINT